MKNRTRRLLAMALSLIMIFSCMSMGVFAADEETVRQYGEEGGYLAIGDSVCRGCGTAGYPQPYYNYSKRNVEGAFPYIVAKAVGCTMPEEIVDQSGNYWPLCYPGMTLGVTMDLYGIEDDFTDTKFDYSNYKFMMKYFGYEGSIPGVRGAAGGDTYTEPAKVGSIIDLTKNASLITVELGMCDVFYRALHIAENGGMLADGINLDFSDPQAILQLLKGYLSEMYIGFDYWKTWYPKFLERLRELNPDADIVVVGAFNVVGSVTITDDTLLPVGDAISALTDQMNVLYQKWAKQYGMIYADISNTETLAAQSEWALLGEFLPNAEIASHPGPEGNAYIGHQILRALPAQDGSHPVTTDIVIDLARFTNVKYVLVNGSYCSDYSMDGTVLTIPYRTTLAKSLVVACDNGDGGTALQSYTLSYQDGGYVSHRISSTNDLNAAMQKIVDLIKSFVSSLMKSISALFDKSGS